MASCYKTCRMALQIAQITSQTNGLPPGTARHCSLSFDVSGHAYRSSASLPSLRYFASSSLCESESASFCGGVRASRAFHADPATARVRMARALPRGDEGVCSAPEEESFRPKCGHSLRINMTTSTKLIRNDQTTRSRPSSAAEPNPKVLHDGSSHDACSQSDHALKSKRPCPNVGGGFVRGQQRSAREGRQRRCARRRGARARQRASRRRG